MAAAAVTVITVVIATTAVMVTTMALIITYYKTLMWLVYRYDPCAYVLMNMHKHMIHLIKLFCMLFTSMII